MEDKWNLMLFDQWFILLLLLGRTNSSRKFLKTNRIVSSSNLSFHIERSIYILNFTGNRQETLYTIKRTSFPLIIKHCLKS